MECNIEANLKKCACTYTGCSRMGKCCECIIYHKSRNEMPGCLFPPDIERTYDRSIGAFIRAMS